MLTNGVRKQKLFKIAKEKIEEQFEYSNFFNMSRLVQHLHQELIIKENKQSLDTKVEFNIPSDDSEEIEIGNDDLD